MRRGAKSTAETKTKGTAGKVRVRRTPDKLLSDLKNKRDLVAASTAKRLGVLDDKIEKIENKYRNQIEIQQLVQEKSVAELEAELQEIRRKSQVLKRAMKQVSPAAGK